MRVVYVILLFVCAIAGATLYSHLSNRAPELEAARIYDSPRPLPNFVLESTHEAQATPESLQGQWTFLFTGYTYCPDICPTTMALLKSRYEELTAATDYPVKIWLISVDPKRDSLAQLTRYVNFFGEHFVGVRADHPQLHPFVTSIGMMYSIPEPDEEVYEVAHSAAIVLVNPQGQQHAIFQPVHRPGEYTTIEPTFLVNDFRKIARFYR